MTITDFIYIFRNPYILLEQDDKWGSKVSGMLEGISRRQNLSANVASILARPATKSKPEVVVSRIPVKVTQATAEPATMKKLSPPAADKAAGETRDATDRAEKAESVKSADTKEASVNEAGDNNDDAHNTSNNNRLLQQPTPPSKSQPEVATSTAPASMTSSPGVAGDEDEDVERVASEYRAILEGASQGRQLNRRIEKLRSKLGAEKQQQRQQDGGDEHVTSAGALVTAQYVLDPNDMQESGGSDTEDSLDRDVRRILSKYGRDVDVKPSSPAAAAALVTSLPDRESPQGSAYETDDTLSHRVHDLLQAQQHSEGDVGGGVVVSHKSKLPLDDMNSTGLSEDTSATAADLGSSLKGRLQDALRGGDEEVKRKPQPTAAFSADPLNDRVRQILADTTHLERREEPVTSSSSSKQRGGVRLVSHSSSSPSSSIDYQNLEKDLDEIQSHLESLKGDGGGGGSTRRESGVSEQSAELRKYVEGRVDDDTLRKTRAAIGRDDANDSQDLSVSESSSRLDPEGQGRSITPTQRPLPLSPLLTSGVVPMNVALDLLHGSAGTTPRDSTYHDRSVDTDILLQQARIRGAGGAARTLSPMSMSRLGGGGSSAGYYRDDPLLNTGVSASDREVMEINAANYKSADDSLTERVSKLVDSNLISPAEPPPRAPVETRSDFTATTTRMVDRMDYGERGASSVNYSSHQSPLLTNKPFSAFGNMHNLFANQLSKVSSARFDTSLEARSPLKPHQFSSDTRAGLVTSSDVRLRGIAGAYASDLQRHNNVIASGSAPVDRDFRSLPPYGRERSPVNDVTSSHVVTGLSSSDALK